MSFINRYIDANKLKAEIERRNLSNYFVETEDYEQKLYEIIDSIQQEQPECSGNLVDIDAVREDFMREVYRVLDADSTNDRANAIIDAFDSLPTVSREHPEGGCSEKPNDLLSEAAKDSWAVYEYRESPRGLYSTCYVDGFKAGAEWMAGQGITVKYGVRVYPTLDGESHPWVSLYRNGINCDSIKDIQELEILGFKDGDDAIVTIRKKEKKNESK